MASQLRALTSWLQSAGHTWPLGVLNLTSMGVVSQNEIEGLRVEQVKPLSGPEDAAFPTLGEDTGLRILEIGLPWTTLEE